MRTYASGREPEAGLQFSIDALPTRAGGGDDARPPARGRPALRRSGQGARRTQAARAQTEAQRAELDAENARLRAEIAAIKAANTAAPDAHDYNEAQTRDAFIDLLLHEAGWPLDQPRDREFQVTGMPNAAGEGFVDYVLWGDDGKPLALVEAKRTKKDARAGQQQAKLYADCLEAAYGRRPVIFYTNGYEHWLWDDASYPPRAVQGFLKKDELMLLHQRRDTRRALADVGSNAKIAGYFYQARAIRRIGEAFERIVNARRCSSWPRAPARRAPRSR